MQVLSRERISRMKEVRKMVITAKEVSEQYFGGRISVSTIYELVRKNEIPKIQISSRKLYFDTDVLDVWIKNISSQPIGTMNPQKHPEYGKLRAIKAEG